MSDHREGLMQQLDKLSQRSESQKLRIRRLLGLEEEDIAEMVSEAERGQLPVGGTALPNCRERCSGAGFQSPAGK